ncbi:MAG TPA: hypothetical protein VFF30_06740 [Nitrososphaerales archaeon]|nr:hypothetical protein [Nitrososphaerales archaeon]
MIVALVLLGLVFVPSLYPNSLTGAAKGGIQSPPDASNGTKDSLSPNSTTIATLNLSSTTTMSEITAGQQSLQAYSTGLEQTSEGMNKLQLAGNANAGNDNSSSTTTASSVSTTGTLSFSGADLALINRTANSQIRFIESLQLSSGAIMESPENPVVYTRDLSLAAFALIRSGNAQAAEKSIVYLLSLSQSASNFSGPGGTRYSSPPAWNQIYSTSGAPLDPSLRGEDQGMALLAISAYVQATGNIGLVRQHWAKVESSANFIVYLQHAPEPGIAYNGLYRHGDNWDDERQENMNGTSPMYSPYWPEYYQWEEENMRMIMGMKGAVLLASDLGFQADAKTWNNSLNAALVGLSNEAMYSKYEAYDYFGSVLWGLQTNIQTAKAILASMPHGFFTPYGVKDLPWLDISGASDTIDYMLCLVRVQNYTGAGLYLHLLTTKFGNPQGGFYDTINLGDQSVSPVSNVYASARFVYFSYVVSTLT